MIEVGESSLHSLSQAGICHYLKIFLVVTVWGKGATRNQWVEASDVTKHPIVHRTALCYKEVSCPNVNGVKIEYPCLRSAIKIDHLSHRLSDERPSVHQTRTSGI